MENLQSYEPYTLHIFDQSYFSGKIQAYMAYKEIPHRSNAVGWMELSGRIAAQTGVVEVPVVERADGVLLRDTTAMIEWFEAHYPRASVLPDDPASAFFCRLLEDYADEGLWRPALYYRWAFDVDSLYNARRFAKEFLIFPMTPEFLIRFQARRRQRRVCMTGLGVTADNRADVEKHYLDELGDLEAVFRQRPFLFGNRPSLADFGYFASMFRHFSLDPTPARLMRDRAPAVFEWVARMWNARATTLEFAEWVPAHDGLPDGLAPLLARAARRYLPSLHANAAAVAAGATTYEEILDGKHYANLKPVPFQAWRRSVLQKHLEQLPAEAVDGVRAVLDRSGCLDWLERDGVLAHGYAEGDDLPFSRPRRIDVARKLRMRIFGTPHHREAGVRAAD